MTARRAAIRLLRWYPRPWRARYASEMRALLEEMPVAWRQAADLAVGAAREWMSPRAFGWPARSAAGRVQIARGFKFAGVAVLFDLVVHTSVVRDAATVQALPYLESAFTALMLISISRMGLGILHWWGRPRWLARLGWFGLLRSAEITFWFTAIVVWLVHQHATPVPAWVREPGFHVIMHHVQLFVWVNLVFGYSRRSRGLQRVLLSHWKRQSVASR